MLPYGRQQVENDDIEAVVDVLRSNWLTTGPKVNEFEDRLAKVAGTHAAVAVNSGTAALHCAMFAAGIGQNDGDEVIVPAITFVATANAAVYLGAKPVFADVDPETLLINPADVAAKITDKTKAIVAMDYAGQPCDYQNLRALADKHNLVLIADSCHALGAKANQVPVGSLADFTCFSFHPIKPITTGEGGAVCTNDQRAVSQMKAFRSHGVTADFRQREKHIAHRYEMQMLGFNYRITDIQCALGTSQLEKLERFTRRRNGIANFYNVLLKESPGVVPLTVNPNVQHAYHLFVVRWNRQLTGVTRDDAFRELRHQGIGANVHYQPVYQHPWYVQRFGDQNGCCPVAEMVYDEILSLPIFPGMVESDVRRVVAQIQQIVSLSGKLGKAA